MYTFSIKTKNNDNDFSEEIVEFHIIINFFQRKRLVCHYSHFGAVHLYSQVRKILIVTITEKINIFESKKETLSKFRKYIYQVYQIVKEAVLAMNIIS